MAQFDEGRFVARDNYCADDLEAYTAGGVLLLDQADNWGAFYFESGFFVGVTNNYASDDFELESLGSIHNLRNGVRNGDCEFSMGKFH